VLARGHAFRIAGTRVGCSAEGPAAAPSVVCGLWGRTTRVIRGTLSVRVGEEALQVFQRPLDGDLALVAELPQPPIPPPQAPPGPEPRPGRTTTLSVGDVATVPGTDLACSVVLDPGLGARCGRLDPTTGQLLGASAVATFSETSVLAARINARGDVAPVFFQRQPFIPDATTVGLELRALARAIHRLPALRRVYHGSRRGVRKARAELRAIAADLRNDRFIDACVRFDPLLYHGFYLPSGSLRGGAGLRYAAAVRRIEHALCG
jgi:hypothetical protein